MKASTLHVSGLSQMVLLKLLKHWGSEGLHRHIAMVQVGLRPDFPPPHVSDQARLVLLCKQEGYRQRRDLFCTLAAKHLTGLAEWHPPSAGMFVWFKVIGVHSTEKLIKERALAQKVDPSLIPCAHDHASNLFNSLVACT